LEGLARDFFEILEKIFRPLFPAHFSRVFPSINADCSGRRVSCETKNEGALASAVLRCGHASAAIHMPRADQFSSFSSCFGSGTAQAVR
jgi:hypothetical protein